MAMITDVGYVLQAIRLSSLRNTDDPVTPRIISLDPAFALNPYINASGLADIDRWPEMKRALDSPPLDPGYSSFEDDVDEGEPTAGRRRRRNKRGDQHSSGGGLKYTQTIMGPGRSGGAGMRVTGRRTDADPSKCRRPGVRANSSGEAANGAMPPTSPVKERHAPAIRRQTAGANGFTSPHARPRADSAPAPMLMGVPPTGKGGLATSMLTTGHGLGSTSILSGTTPIEQALSTSGTSEFDDAEEGYDQDIPPYQSRSTLGVEDSSMGVDDVDSARPSDLGVIMGGNTGRLDEALVDEGSDVEEDDIDDEGIRLPAADGASRSEYRRRSLYDDNRRISFGAEPPPEQLSFEPVDLLHRQNQSQSSALTALLHRHIPHLISTSSSTPSILGQLPNSTLANPFASLYASVAAPISSQIPGQQIELYFPHSRQPSVALVVKVRKDATVEEVTGYGLWKYWEEGREPQLSEQTDSSETRWTTVGWGLRIVEDDGEVDEDFPALDRDSQISKFAYGQFAIVEATVSQIRQSAAKAPLIVRRSSRVIAANKSVLQPAVAQRPKLAQGSSVMASAASFAVEPLAPIVGSTMKGSVGLSSALSKPVLLRVKVTASADVHFTTTISVPTDMYIADLTEVLCKRKRLAMPSTDWVLCLADLSLALPLDRTVASLEGKTDLALVRRQWAIEHGLRTDDRRGGDPSASIFKRQSEPLAAQRFGFGVADFAQTYKKYNVTRKIAIGRHERVLAIDGDYIHIMPSESRAFFDSMKTTSFHITLVASCKLSGRAGGFKVNVWRDGAQKRYDFEAENGRQAAEIISSIRQRMKTYQAERTSLLPPPRPAPAPSRR